MRFWRKKYGLAAIVGATVVALTLFGIETTKVLRTQRAIDAVRRLGGSACRSDVCFDDGIPHGAFMPVNPPGWRIRCARAIGADWLFDVVYVDFRGDYKGNSVVADGDLAILAEFPNLLFLDLGNTGISDEGLKHLAGLRKLRILDLQRTRVTDAGLAQLAGLKELRSIHLDGTCVKGWGVDRLKRAIPAVNAGPEFEREMADWKKLEDEVDELVRRKHSADTVKEPGARGRLIVE